MKYSVIIPYYNVSEEYLNQCIESILSQKGKFIVETIIIDDGSKIFPFKCVEEKEIIYYRQTNQGVSVARNQGIRMATGDYILFVDPDDTLAPNALNVFNEFIVNNPNVDFIIANNGVIKNNNYLYEHKSNNKSLITDKRQMIMSVLSCEEVSENLSSGSPWAKLFKRSFLIENNLKFIPDLKKCQDRIFMLYVYQKLNEVVFLDKLVYYYRTDNPQSICNRYNEGIDIIVKRVIEEAYMFVSDYYSYDDDILLAYEKMKAVLTTDVLRLKYFNLKSHDMGYFHFKIYLERYINDTNLKVTIKNLLHQKKISFKRKILYFVIENEFYLILYLFGYIYKAMKK